MLIFIVIDNFPIDGQELQAHEQSLDKMVIFLVLVKRAYTIMFRKFRYIIEIIY